jgi:hypothetical protein
MRTKYWTENLKEENHFEYQDAGRRILKSMLQKLDPNLDWISVELHSMWRKAFVNKVMKFEIQKRWKIPCVPEPSLASQAVVCCVEQVNRTERYRTVGWGPIQHLVLCVYEHLESAGQSGVHLSPNVKDTYSKRN